MRHQGRLTEWKDDRGFGFITPLAGSVASAVVIASVYTAALAVVGAFFPVAWLILGVDVVVSAATVLAYRGDKLAARQRRWRTEESALHLMAIGGGWPGALFAQRLYHHKTRKVSFQIVFWITVVLNIGFTVWLIAVF